MKTNNWVTVSHVIPINHEIAVEISFLKYEKKRGITSLFTKVNTAISDDSRLEMVLRKRIDWRLSCDGEVFGKPSCKM